MIIVAILVGALLASAYLPRPARDVVPPPAPARPSPPALPSDPWSLLQADAFVARLLSGQRVTPPTDDAPLF
jgi:hypothetical protein